jgi:propanol-preferring alcohol dehydrogenase
MRSLKKGGTLAIAGIHLSEIPALNYQRDLFFERDLRSVTANTRSDGRDLLEAAVKCKVHVHTKTYPLADANLALQDLKADRINGTGVLRIY